MSKIFDSDDEDLAYLSDSCSHASSTSTHSSKASKSSSSKVTKLKNKENSVEKSDMKTKRKSCVPNLITGNLKEPPLVTRITRNSIKTQPSSKTRSTWSVNSTTNQTINTPTKKLSVNLQKIETTVFDFDSGERDDIPLSYVTRSGRKAKKTNPRVTKEEIDDDNDKDKDYKNIENESESESENSDKVESENNDDYSSDSDFEV